MCYSCHKRCQRHLPQSTRDLEEDYEDSSESESEDERSVSDSSVSDDEEESLVFAEEPAKSSAAEKSDAEDSDSMILDEINKPDVYFANIIVKTENTSRVNPTSRKKYMIPCFCADRMLFTTVEGPSRHFTRCKKAKSKR